MAPDKAFCDWVGGLSAVRRLTPAAAQVMRDAFKAGYAAHKEFVSRPQWSLMDSAPLDGTLILVKTANGNRHTVMWTSICNYGGRKAWCIPDSWQAARSGSGDDAYLTTVAPIGWMPLNT